MKPLYSVLGILTALTIIGMVTVGTQQVYGPRTCGGCSEFKKMTTEFEKAVIDAWGNPEDKSRLLDEYVSDVRALWERESPPPEPE